MEDKNSHIFYFDLLNVLACIAVIAMHHNGIVHVFSPTSAWAEALVIEVLCYWAVPVFFMLSGAKLLDYRDRYDTKTFFLKRLLKTFIPFLIWSITWCVIYSVETKTLPSCADLIIGVVNSKYQPVYWFFIPLLGLYLLIPVLSWLRTNINLLLYIEAIIFLCTGTLVPLLRFLNLPDIAILSSSLSAPVFYCLAGYLLSKVKLPRWMFRLMVIGTLFCFFIRYYYTYAQSYHYGFTAKGLFYISYFTTIIPALTVFELFKRMELNGMPNIKKTISKFASCSFGIYLVHMLVIKLFLLTGFFDESDLIWRTIGVFFTYFTSLLIVCLGKKTKLGKYIFP